MQFRPGLAPIKFSCSRMNDKSLQQKRPTAQNVRKGELSLQIVNVARAAPVEKLVSTSFCAASSSGGMFDAISAMEEDFKKQKPNQMIMPV